MEANNNTAKATSQQPIVAPMMVTTSAPEGNKQEHKSMRLRGGGAAKDCFLGAVDCFICFEGCRVCCDCFADIICCPCEMCC